MDQRLSLARQTANPHYWHLSSHELADARQRNIEIKRLIADGVNPKTIEEQQASQNGLNVFDNIAQSWYSERKTYLAESTFSRNYSAYMRDVKPSIGHKSIKWL